jgi:GNAT superfamily N-acetyltransferase
MQIRPYNEQDLDAVIRLSLRAWAPVFASIEQAMAPEVYQVFYPEGWRASQQKAVADVCAAQEHQVWIAEEVEEEGTPVGFVAVKLHPEGQIGEIYMIAVDPDFQRRGHARALLDVALAWIKEAGMAVAMVETGGDPGHAPARHTYEQSGFGLFPVARYFKKV